MYFCQKSSNIIISNHKLYSCRSISIRELYILIFRYWISLSYVIDQVEAELVRKAIGFERIDGSTVALQRQEAMERLNSPSETQVMLLSLKAGGVGLNLTGANHLFLLDLHWNPALEAQACDRVYRVGSWFSFVFPCYLNHFVFFFSHLNSLHLYFLSD